jgi:hypothetical protein
VRGQYELIKKDTLEFAARFGFVTREIFNDHLANVGRSQAYAYWMRLIEEGFLISYKGVNATAYLSAKGRVAYVGQSMPTRAIYLIPHDQIVANALLTIKKTGLVQQYWTEHELKASVTEACAVLGTGQISKYPDLVLQMKSSSGSVKIAVEIERTQKTKSRMNQVAYNYLQAKGIEFLIFGCAHASIERSILASFGSDLFAQAGKVPATYLLRDLDENGLEVSAQFMGYKMSLHKMLLAAVKLPDWKPDLRPDSNRIAVRRKSGFEKSKKGKIAC